MKTACIRCGDEITEADAPFCDYCWEIHGDDGALTAEERSEEWEQGRPVYFMGDLWWGPPPENQDEG